MPESPIHNVTLLLPSFFKDAIDILEGSNGIKELLTSPNIQHQFNHAAKLCLTRASEREEFPRSAPPVHEKPAASIELKIDFGSKARLYSRNFLNAVATSGELESALLRIAVDEVALSLDQRARKIAKASGGLLEAMQSQNDAANAGQQPLAFPSFEKAA